MFYSFRILYLCLTLINKSMTHEQKSVNSLVINSGLPAEKTQEIAENLSSFFSKASEWSEKINDIVITDPTQVREMKLARESRLMLRGYRLDAEKLIKEKRDVLKEKMSDDILFDKLLLNANKMIKATFENLETKLQEKEKFAERWESEQKAKLRSERIIQLAKYSNDVSMYPVENMSVDQYEKLLNGLKLSFEQRQEQERIEAEQQRFQLELKRRQYELISAGFLWNGTSFVFMEVNISPEEIKTLKSEDFDIRLKEAKELIQEIKSEATPNTVSVLTPEAPATPTLKTNKEIKLEFLNAIDQFTIELPFGAINVEDEIKEKFKGFKKWAKNLIMTNI